MTPETLNACASLFNAFTRSIVNFYCDQLAEGWAGRRLAAIIEDAGVADVVVAPATSVTAELAVLEQFVGLRDTVALMVAAGIASQAVRSARLEQVREADRRSRCFAAVTCFMVGGDKQC